MNLTCRKVNVVKVTIVRMVSTINKYNQSDGGYLAYNQYKTNEINKPGIIFLCGWGSQLDSRKGGFLEHYCKINNLNYTRFSYNGHEPSSGRMEDFNIGIGLNNTLDILDNLTTGIL